MMKLTLPALLFCFCTVSCAQQKQVSAVSEVNEGAIAFPGAEGFGMYATGGRGGKVIIVTNLDDSGPGSLREAVKSKKPKIVVFATSGTIHLTSPLEIEANTTIAGQTAPGDGICLADYPVTIGGNNVIVRYMRFRMGDRYQNKGKVAGAGHDDAFSAQKRSNIIIDHCSMSWSTDEVFSIYRGDSTTIQWNLISEPLNYSYHFEKDDTDFEKHGYGGIWGGKRLSAHHNLIAHAVSRTPRFDGIRNDPEEFVDYRNNVIFNWVQNNVYGGEGGNYNIVNNYYKYGPSTSKSVQFRIVNPLKTAVIPFGKFYVDGNYVDGSDETTKNNHLGVVLSNGSEDDKRTALIPQPKQFASVITHAATEAYNLILLKAGASFKRDTLDQRVINDVKNRTGRIIDVQGGFPHGSPYETTQNAWPSLRSLPAPKDSDADGMPDDWENKNGLNANDTSDSTQNKLHKHYTNIEVYINSLTK
ncbi:MAG TPA: pectate lyase [Segetibacter sp.]